MNRYGIEEVKDILNLADHLIDEMADALEDDGKIDGKEMIQAIIGEPSVVFKAIWGSWDVPGEIEDLNPNETKEILEKALPIIKKLADLFV